MSWDGDTMFFAFPLLTGCLSKRMTPPSPSLQISRTISEEDVTFSPSKPIMNIFAILRLISDALTVVAATMQKINNTLYTFPTFSFPQ
jgi:hypothetical protein